MKWQTRHRLYSTNGDRRNDTKSVEHNKREHTPPKKDTVAPLFSSAKREAKNLQSASLSTSLTGLDRQGTQRQKKVSKERHGVHDCNNGRESTGHWQTTTYKRFSLITTKQLNRKINGWMLDFAMAAIHEDASRVLSSMVHSQRSKGESIVAEINRRRHLKPISACCTFLFIQICGASSLM